MNLEQDIISTAHSAITAAIKSQLEGYNSPLQPLIKKVIEQRSPEIEAMLNESVTEALAGNFRVAMKDACSRKLAKVIISKSEGEIEKQANELRSSVPFRAQLTLAIDKCIRDFNAGK